MRRSDKMTTIEWVKDQAGNQGKSWNPIVGCSKVSPGCRHCYAEVMARRLKGMGRSEYQNVINGNSRWTGEVTLVPERLEEPLKRKKPTTYFVNSMSDLFHEDVSDDAFWEVMGVMRQCYLDNRGHTFQILTKRADRMLEMMTWWYTYCHEHHPWPNIWLGVSVENQKTADERYEAFRQVPAAVKFVSYEPALGYIDWQPWIRFVDWFIVGGESGSNARPMYPDWARSLRDQCQAAGTPFFFKQWGSAKSDVLEVCAWERAGRDFSQKKGGRLLDGREWNEMPERKEQIA
jgi:protein gp37